MTEMSLEHAQGGRTVRMGSLPDFVPDSLRRCAVQLEIRRGEYLFQSGRPVSRLYFVAAGELRLIEYAASGADCVLQRAGPGEWIGECSTCVDRYSCYARASRNSQVIGIPMARFTELLRGDPALANAWASQLATSLRKTFARYERRSLKTARERVLHYLVAESRGGQAVDLAQSFATLAGELGLTREALYRTLALLERNGDIRREGRRLSVISGPPPTPATPNERD